MRKLLITSFAALAALAGWASSPGAGQSIPAVIPGEGTAAPARGIAPDVLLKAVTSDVIALIRQDGDIQAGNPAKLAELVESRILPHFDFTRMTRIAMARNWRQATPVQKQALTAEYRKLLVRTYSTALSGYRDQAIDYKPLRAARDATEVTVKSTVTQPGAERTTLDYEMEKTTAGWKVYDIKVAGISLVSTYQPGFARTIRDGGVEGLVQSLSAENRQAETELVTRARSAHPFLFILYAVIPSLFHSGR